MDGTSRHGRSRNRPRRANPLDPLPDKCEGPGAMEREVHVIDHPLITHKLTVLRDERTPSPVFRQLTEELLTLLAYEATRNVRVEEIEIQTP
ncbi:MAG: hypothetical protein KC731_43290, partial [Myxococcales bacterium]|nr:hypothetical protein [Myxococcales bacterium]